MLLSGRDATGQLVGIDQVASGRVDLACPYCDGPLVARKGRVIAHHFAHRLETCLDVQRASSLGIPFFTDLEQLPSLERGDLNLLARLRRAREINVRSLRGGERRAFLRLERTGLVEAVPPGRRWVDGVGSHRHTDFGLRVVAARSRRLSLARFAALQREAIERRLRALEDAASSGGGAARVDLQLFRAELERARGVDLYLLDVRIDSLAIHKIGVTTRPIEERRLEVEADLRGHFGRTAELGVRVERVWCGRGPLELYAKRRFARFRVTIGRLTEYFEFGAEGLDAAPRGPLRELDQLGALPAEPEASVDYSSTSR